MGMVTSLTGWIGNASYIGLSMVVTIYNGNCDIITWMVVNASYIVLSMVVTIYNGATLVEVGNGDIINWMDWQCQLHWSKYGGHNLQWEW